MYYLTHNFVVTCGSGAGLTKPFAVNNFRQQCFESSKGDMKLEISEMFQQHSSCQDATCFTDQASLLAIGTERDQRCPFRAYQNNLLIRNCRASSTAGGDGVKSLCNFF